MSTKETFEKSKNPVQHFHTIPCKVFRWENPILMRFFQSHRNDDEEYENNNSKARAPIFVSEKSGFLKASKCQNIVSLFLSELGHFSSVFGNFCFQHI